MESKASDSSTNGFDVAMEWQEDSIGVPETADEAAEDLEETPEHMVHLSTWVSKFVVGSVGDQVPASLGNPIVPEIGRHPKQMLFSG